MKKSLQVIFIFSLLFFVYSEISAQNIRLNEIYSRGGSTVHPDPDWIEIYNPGNASVDISGYKIYDSGGQTGSKPKMTIADNTTLPAKGFLVIVTDIATTVNPAGFGLSSGGEKVWLENKTGTIIDSVAFVSMTETQTYGREYNGSTWALINNMTKGTSNSAIVMNEIYSRGGSATHPDPDWIEIYNNSSAQIDISGYKIYDSGGNGGTKPKFAIPDNTLLPAKGFLVIVTDIATTVNPAGFGLSSGGEEVWLEDKNGVVIDNFTFGSMTESQTFSRITDGGNWALSDKMTKGLSNSSSTAVEDNNSLPTVFSLSQNYPNPFNPETTINYTISKQGYVTLKIYNVLGKEVATLVNDMMSAGQYTVKFSAKNISSGIYFYSLKSGNLIQTKKMTILK